MANDTVPRTLVVATVLCIVCSVCVSVAAVVLRPAQERNRALDRKRNILVAAGMYEEGGDIDEIFARIETRLVDFDTGDFIEGEDVEAYDQRDAARDPARSVAIARADDLGNIRRRANKGLVYLAKDPSGELETLILPVRGMGLWGTMYGFLALRPDLNTVAGFAFYEHVETPGLGGEVDAAWWKAKWTSGKKLFAPDGSVAIAVIKGTVDESRRQAIHQVDGLAGATITTRGVHNLLRYWLGAQGYGPLLSKLKGSSPENKNG